MTKAQGLRVHFIAQFITGFLLLPPWLVLRAAKKYFNCFSRSIHSLVPVLPVLRKSNDMFFGLC
jgi:hypothetical protein